MPVLWPGSGAQSFFPWETILYTRHLCSSAKSSINLLHKHGTVSGEVLVLLYQQETEEEQQQKAQDPARQGAQGFLFPELSGSYQAGQ